MKVHEYSIGDHCSFYALIFFQFPFLKVPVLLLKYVVLIIVVKKILDLKFDRKKMKPFHYDHEVDDCLGNFINLRTLFLERHPLDVIFRTSSSERHP